LETLVKEGNFAGFIPSSVCVSVDPARHCAQRREDIPVLIENFAKQVLRAK